MCLGGTVFLFGCFRPLCQLHGAAGTVYSHTCTVTTVGMISPSSVLKCKRPITD